MYKGERTMTESRERPPSPGRGSESALYDAVCPAVYVIRVFGLAPYEFARDPGTRRPRLRGSWFNCLFSLFWTGVYSYVVFLSLAQFNGLDSDKPVLGVTETGKLVLNYVVMLADMTLCLAHRERFARIWNDIEDFDEAHELNRRGARMLRVARLFVWSSLAVCVAGWTLVNQLGMRAFNEPYLKNVGYMLTYVGSCVAVFKICGLIFLLGQRFAYLNCTLERQLEVIRTKRTARLEVQAAVAIVKKTESSYDQLLSTSEKLNDIYSSSLLLFLFHLFCHVVSNMYYFAIWTIIDRIYFENPMVVFCIFSWLLIYLAQLFLLHLACHLVSHEANRMAVVLLDWRRHADRLGKQNEFSSTLHYANRRMNFKAGGCFDVNLPLLTSTFGHLTTYLVILLQLPNSKNS